MRAWRLSGILLFVAAFQATPAAAQLCLGRTFAGELSISADVGVVDGAGVIGRLSVGGELTNGLGGRVGVVAGLVDRDEWRPHMGQAELFWSLPLGGRIHVCPGVSGYRTVPRITYATTLLDAFTSVGLEVPLADGGTLVPFLTPQLVVEFEEDSRITMSPDEPGVTRTVWTTEVRAAGVFTGGVALLMGPLSLRAMVSAAVLAPDLIRPALAGFSVGVRPFWESRQR